jgi:large subunit ribosomal protein L18
VSSRKLEVSKKAVTKTDAARQTGEALAKQMLAANVTAAVFDRGAYRYHGRVKAVAEALRSAGVQV